MKKSLIASFLAGAGLLSASAYGFQSSTISFDVDGAGGTAPILVDTFDWAPDNGVSVDAIGFQDGSSKNLLAQAKLGTFQYEDPITNIVDNYLPVAGTEFTFQFSVWEIATGIGTSTAGFVLDPSKPSYFKIYYDTSKDANPLLGTGYGDGTVILEGTIVGLTGNFTSFTDFSTTDSRYKKPEKLDQFGTNNYLDVITDVGNGSTTIDIDVLAYDPDFFKTNIKKLTIDVNLTTNQVVPFVQVNPSAQVVGHNVNFGTASPTSAGAPEVPTGVYKWNGLDTCGTTIATDKCDFLLQTDAANTFQTVPEPASIGLVGIGLIGLGFVARRRKSAQS